MPKWPLVLSKPLSHCDKCLLASPSMHTISRLTAMLSVSIAAVSPAIAADLARKPALGVRMAPAPQGSAGVLVPEVMPGGTAMAIGLHNDDIVLSAGGRPIARSTELAAYAS